jgi:glycosyltransferase involved in cell wall biosynthesis
MPNAWMGTNSLDRRFLRAAGALVPPTDKPPPVTPTLLNLARFEPDIKGQHMLLEALAGHEWSTREWRLLLAGGGRHPATLRRLLGYYGLRERVEILDYRADVLDIIRAADLAVMASISEGMPYALLEMMAAGLPAVGTPVGGIPELIEDGRTGWLSRAADAPAIADALERAWIDMVDWPAFGRRAADAVSASYCADDALPRLGTVLRDDVGSACRLR